MVVLGGRKSIAGVSFCHFRTYSTGLLRRQPARPGQERDFAMIL
jgi:hypothetical protein